MSRSNVLFTRAAVLVALLAMTVAAFAQDSLNVNLAGSLEYARWGRTEALTVSGEYAYVQTLYDGLHILEASNPSAPVDLVGYQHPYDIVKMTVSGSWLYAAAQSDGIVVLDVSEPSDPVEAGVYPAPNSVQELFVEDGFLYAAAREAGLRIYDLTDPSTPVEVGFWDSPGNESIRNVFVDREFAYLTSINPKGMWIIDVSDPAAPVELGMWEYVSSAFPYDIAVRDGFAYVACDYYGIRIVDVSDPAAPFEAGAVDESWSNTKGLVVEDGYLCSVEYGGGFRVFDLSDPVAPVLIGTQVHPPEKASSLAISGTDAYVGFTLGAVMKIIDISHPAHPATAWWFDDPGITRGVWSVGNYVYLSNNKAGVRIIDVTLPWRPVERAFLDGIETVSDMAVDGELAYVSAGTRLYVVDVSDPLVPEVLSSCETAKGGVVFEGEYVYVTNYSSGLHIVDVHDPSLPVEVGSWAPPQFTTVGGVVVDAGYAYVAAGELGVAVIDISDPSAPVLDHYYDPWWIGEMGNMVEENGYAYLLDEVAGESTGISVLDLGTPGDPVLVTYIPSGLDWTYDLEVENGYVYLARREHGVWVLDAHDPTQLPTIGYYDGLEGNENSIAVRNGFAYMANDGYFYVMNCRDAIGWAGLPPIEVHLIAAEPVVVPRGGNFTYGAQLVSHLPDLFAVDIWTEVVTPTNTVYGPIWQLWDVPVESGAMLSATIGQAVPLWAALGEYTFRMKAGMFGMYVAGDDEFPFEVTTAGEGVRAPGAQQWAGTGYAQAFGVSGGDGATAAVVADEYRLAGVWPNPFNASATVTVELPELSELTVAVYNVAGQRVAELVRGRVAAGTQQFTFDAAALSSGIYFVRATVPYKLNAMRKVVLVK